MGGMKVGEFVSNNMQQHHPHPKSNSTGAQSTEAWLAWEVPYMVLLRQLEDASTTRGTFEENSIVMKIFLAQSGRAQSRKSFKHIFIEGVSLIFLLFWK